MGRSRNRGSGGGGSVSRRTALVMLAGGGALAIGGVGAYDVVTGDRAFDLGVSPDDDALLGIVPLDPVGEGGETVDVFELHNQGFANRFDTIDVTRTKTGNPNVDIENIQVSPPLEPGEQVTVQGDLVCEAPASNVPITFDITLEGNGQYWNGERTVDVTCEVDLDLDPYDCHDVADMDADFNPDSPFIMRGGERDGHTRVEDDGDVAIELRGNAELHGFLHGDAGTNLGYESTGSPWIDGAVRLDADGDITVDGSATSEIEGDFCMFSGGNSTVTVSGTMDITRELKIDAGGEVNMTVSGDVIAGDDLRITAGEDVTLKVQGNATITGDMNIIAGGDVDVTFDGNAATLEGDFCVDADGDFSLQEQGRNAGVQGEVTEGDC